MTVLLNNGLERGVIMTEKEFIEQDERCYQFKNLVERWQRLEKCKKALNKKDSTVSVGVAERSCLPDNYEFASDQEFKNVLVGFIDMKITQIKERMDNL